MRDRSVTTILILRGVISALVLTLGVAALASGRTLFGVLFVAMGITNVVLILVISRRRAEMRRGLSRADRPES